MNINECYSLASGHFLTERIPEDMLDMDDNGDAIDDFIRDHMTETFAYSGWPVFELWELIEGIGMDYYKLTNASIK